jgi:hypothetical protein
VQAQQLVQAVAAFKLGQGSVSSPATTPMVAASNAKAAKAAERRGPARAKNVVRPSFVGGTVPRKAGTVVAAPAPRTTAPVKTGTDDWESF